MKEIISIDECARVAIKTAIGVGSALILISLSFPLFSAVAKKYGSEIRDSFGFSAEAIFIRGPEILERRFEQLSPEQKVQFRERFRNLLEKIEQR